MNRTRKLKGGESMRAGKVERTVECEASACPEAKACPGAWWPCKSDGHMVKMWKGPSKARVCP